MLKPNISQTKEVPEDCLKPKISPTCPPKKTRLSHTHTHHSSSVNLYMRKTLTYLNNLGCLNVFKLFKSIPAIVKSFLIFLKNSLGTFFLLPQRCLFGEVIHLQLRTAGSSVHPSKTNMTNGKTHVFYIFNRRYIFIHRCLCCFVQCHVSFWGCNSWLCFTGLPSFVTQDFVQHPSLLIFTPLNLYQQKTQIGISGHPWTSGRFAGVISPIKNIPPCGSHQLGDRSINLQPPIGYGDVWSNSRWN